MARRRWKHPPQRDSPFEPIYGLELHPDDPTFPELSRFYRKARKGLRQVFLAARGKEHVQFAFALSAEARGMREVGWNTAHEASRAVQQFGDLIRALRVENPVRVRVGLSLYSHLAEAAGYYEVPKNMLNIAGGGYWSMYPFRELVDIHKHTGDAIAPNASRVLKDLIGHAATLGFVDLCEVITEAFDFDLRNGYAHADYIVWNDGIRLPRRNGGPAKIVSYERFGLLLNKALSFFSALEEVQGECLQAYDPPRLVRGRMNSQEDVEYAILTWNPQKLTFSVKMYGDVGPNHPALKRELASP